MDIDDVRTFVAVADAGSVSRAAAELHLTQPAVTRRVQRFEDQVGAPLLDRRSRPFVVTDVGRATLERCRRLLSTVGELTAVTRRSAEPSGELRIGVAHALTELALDRAVDRVHRAFPGVALRLRTGWSRDLLSRVKSGALEGAIVLLPEDARVPTGLAADAVARERLLAVAARNWTPASAQTVRQAKRRAPRLEDLAEAGWVLNPDGCAARGALHDVLASARLPLRVNVEAYDYELQLALVASGRGLGLIPARLLARSRSRTRVRPLRVGRTIFPFTVWMVTGQVSTTLERPMLALKEAVLARFSKTERLPHSLRRAGIR